MYNYIKQLETYLGMKAFIEITTRKCWEKKHFITNKHSIWMTSLITTYPRPYFYFLLKKKKTKLQTTLLKFLGVWIIHSGVLEFEFYLLKFRSIWILSLKFFYVCINNLSIYIFRSVPHKFTTHLVYPIKCVTSFLLPEKIK